MAKEKLRVTPLSFMDAAAFVDEHHRHNRAPKFHKFSLGARTEAGDLVGVCVVGRPVSRLLDNGRTLEVLRLCAVGGVKNVSSMLYGAAARAAQALGYERIITYTLAGKRDDGTPVERQDWVEQGKSLEASGWTVDGYSRGKPWTPRIEKRVGGTVVKARANEHPLCDKIRWLKVLNPPATTVDPDAAAAVVLPPSPWTVTNQADQVIVTHEDGRRPIILTLPYSKQWVFEGPSGWHTCDSEISDRSDPYEHLKGYIEYNVDDPVVRERIYDRVEYVSGVGRYVRAEMMQERWQEEIAAMKRRLPSMSPKERQETEAAIWWWENEYSSV